ncbi:hypothetical protein [Thiobacillus sp.]|uniref:hypothetical protein n=1 Tax=Thiobacillus sp. TaxID=924 RepID=UPI0011DA4061|nr:hypothetical protein [Thiobacillus sp.]TXH76747.1 MAG: hypothetical protein E6Q82_01245 [Thiobacillus sp.]
MALGKLQLITIAVLGLVSTSTIADDGGSKIQHLVDPVTSIESWMLHDKGFEVELIQISPDQARGFFLARGFDRKNADFYAASCVLALRVRNKSQETISYDLANWRYMTTDGVKRKLKLKDKWLHEWEQRGVSKSAQIAFEWSQHPLAQTLEPKDWNQGMTTYQIAHGSVLDLTVKWNIGDKQYVDTIKGVRCAD